MKDVNKIFESIHEVYESHDGGVIWLSDDEKLLIKNQLRQLILANKNEYLSGVRACPNCENPYPHIHPDGVHVCEECGKEYR